MANISLEGKEALQDTFIGLWRFKDSKIEGLSILKSAEECEDVQSFSFRGEVKDILDNLLLVDKEKLKNLIGDKNVGGIRLFSKLGAANAIVSIEDPGQPESLTVLVKVIDVENKEYDHMIGDRYRILTSLLTKTNLRLIDTITLGIPHFSLEKQEGRKTGLDLCIPICKNTDNNTIEVISYMHEKNIGTIKTIKHVAPQSIRPISNSVKSTLYETALVIGTEKLSETFGLPVGSILTGFEFEEYSPNDSLKVKSIGTGIAIDYEDFLNSELALVEDLFNHVSYGVQSGLDKEKFEDIFFNRELPLSLRLFNEANSVARINSGRIDSEEARRIQAIIDSMA